MSLDEAFVSYERYWKNVVQSETWGHLYPEEEIAHSGFILFSFGQYGDITVINSAFEGVASSPWYYQDEQNFIAEQGLESGKVYKFIGTYVKHKDQTCDFSGIIEEVI